MNEAVVNGRVAQLGEHLLCKQGVAGSIPATSTIFPLCPHCFGSGFEGEVEVASLPVCPILCPPSLSASESYGTCPVTRLIRTCGYFRVESKRNEATRQ